MRVKNREIEPLFARLSAPFLQAQQTDKSSGMVVGFVSLAIGKGNYTFMETQIHRTNLKLTEGEMREWGAAALDMVIRHLEDLPNKPVITLPDKDAIRAKLHEPIPQQPESLGEMFNVLHNYVFKNMAHPDHPRFFPFVPGPGNFISAIADLMSSGYNTFTGTWLEAAGPTEVELTTLNWLRDLYGLPETTRGIFLSGGSTANWTALSVAREAILRDDSADAQDVKDERRVARMTKLTVYMSDQTHHSMDRSFRLLGFVDRQIRKISTDDHFQIDLNELRAKIREDRANGKIPAILVGNAGATNTGTIDPLDKLAQIAQEEGLWLHADAAYGGAAILCESTRHLLNGVDKVDSLTVDPHKWLFQPYEIGCVLVRDGENLRRTFEDVAEYIEDEMDRPDEINLQDYGHQQSRNFRALKLWLSLKVFGLEAFSKAVTHGVNLAEMVESAVNNSRHLRVISGAKIGVINFRYEATGYTEAELNTLNKHIVEKMQEDRFAMVHTTVLKGKKVIRMCIINPRTTEYDVLETLRRIEAFGDALVGVQTDTAHPNFLSFSLAHNFTLE